MKIGIDVDDVLMPFVDIACQLCNVERGTSYSAKDITCWGFGGSLAIKEVSEYYSDERVFLKQRMPQKSIAFLKKLMKENEVYIVTAVSGHFMSLRYKQIKEAIPDFPDDKIIMGTAKDIMKLDITLDDGPHNILKSNATYPVLLRKSWNKDLSGVLAVNTLDDFLILVKQIKESVLTTQCSIRKPTVIALIGPSGSKKNELAKVLFVRNMGQIVNSYRLDKKWEYQESFAAQTIYGRINYGYKMNDLFNVLNNNQNPICVVDMAGAMALKRLYPTVLIFCKQSRESMFLEIMKKNALSSEEKAIRCTSMEQELRNESLCDLSIRTEDLNIACDKIISYLN